MVAWPCFECLPSAQPSLRCGWPRTSTRATCLALLAGLTGSAVAEPANATWSGAATLLSDKVLRGISQTQGHTTVQFDLNLRSDTGWAAGLGIAPLRRGGDATQSSDAEVLASLGRGWQLEPDWSLQAAVARYLYPGRGRRSREYDYTELSAMLGWQGRVFATVAVSPDTSAFDPQRGLRRGSAATLELTGRQRLYSSLALDAGIGYYDLSRVRDSGYRYGSIGLSWGRGPLQAYLMRTSSNAASRGVAAADVSGGRWVASLAWNF